jgi:RHS repeat-associated protein
MSGLGNAASRTDSTGTATFTWHFENRLASVSLPNGSVVNFKYDPFGRRIQKVSSSGTIIYAYDGDNVIEQLNASGAASARYTQGLGIDEPLEVHEGTASYYYRADGLGSVTELTKSGGSVANTYYYGSFGDDSPASSETVANPFHFTARERDSETKLYYYRARYYDPLFGRFLSEDPVRFETGNNFYRYVFNDPIDLVDSEGLRPCCPKEAELEIRDRIKKIRGILDRVGRTGTAVGPQPSALAVTGCARRYIRGGPELPPVAMTTYYISPEQKPCLFKCVDAHEAVHRRMCEKLGAHRYNALSEAEKETPAYITELGCSLHLLQTAGLSLLF